MSIFSVVYFRNPTIQEELDIEKFWIEIKEELYNVEEDNSNIRISTQRMHQSAVVGEYAGISIDILIIGIPLIDATLNIWEKIINHLNKKINQNKDIRINNLTSLENICKIDLILQKNVKNAQIVSSKILTKNYQTDRISDIKFIYEGALTIENAAEITFENKTEKFIYTIQTNGNIIEYRRLKNKT